MPNKNRIKEVLETAVDGRVFPGCALMWTKNGELDKLCVGRYTYEKDAPPVSVNSVYDCASITKSIPVSCLALRLISENKLTLDDNLIKYVHEYCGSFREEINIKHLLTHTLDFDFRLSDHKNLPAKKLLDEILNVRLSCKPNEKFFYANATSILLGMVIEKIYDKPLHVAAQEIFFDPLDMRDTTFFPTDDIIDSIVPTEIDAWRGREIRGEVHDESAWVLREIMTAGSAGLFSTASDLIKFIGMLINYPQKFFSDDVIAAMQTNQIPHIENFFTGLGWELNQEYMGTNRRETTFGKTGFTGTCVVMDRSLNVGAVMLTNRTYPARPKDRGAINGVRSDVFDLIFSGE